MLPSSVSAAVPSVTDVYFLVRQSYVYCVMRMDTSTPMRRAITRTLSPRKILVSATYCLYSSASEQFTKSTFSVTVGKSQPTSNSACAALRISA